MPVKQAQSQQSDLQREAETRQVPQESHTSLLAQGRKGWGRKSEGIEVQTEMKCHGGFLVSEVKGKEKKEKNNKATYFSSCPVNLISVIPFL